MVTVLSLSRHYRPFSALLNSQVGPVFSPIADANRGFDPLLAALLDVRAHELLGVLLEHLVDLVEDRVDVVGELLVPLLDLLGGRGLVLLGLLGTPRRLPLAPGVLRRHLPFLRPLGAHAPSTAPTLSSPGMLPSNPPDFSGQ